MPVFVRRLLDFDSRLQARGNRLEPSALDPYQASRRSFPVDSTGISIKHWAARLYWPKVPFPLIVGEPRWRGRKPNTGERGERHAGTEYAAGTLRGAKRGRQTPHDTPASAQYGPLKDGYATPAPACRWRPGDRSLHRDGRRMHIQDTCAFSFTEARAHSTCLDTKAEGEPARVDAMHFDKRERWPPPCREPSACFRQVVTCNPIVRVTNAIDALTDIARAARSIGQCGQAVGNR